MISIFFCFIPSVSLAISIGHVFFGSFPRPKYRIYNTDLLRKGHQGVPHPCSFSRFCENKYDPLLPSRQKDKEECSTNLLAY